MRGAFNCCRAVLPGMVERGGGRVVNVGSLTGGRDETYISGYACAKTAYLRLTGTLAAETAGLGITVFCVSPGLVRARMVEELLGEAGRRWRPWIAAAAPEDCTPGTTWTRCWPTRPGSSPTTCSPCACGSGRGLMTGRSRCREGGVGWLA